MLNLMNAYKDTSLYKSENLFMQKIKNFILL